MKKRFEHAISFNFVLKSNNENPTPKEILEKIQAKVSELNEDTILNEVEIFDTLDNDED